MSKNEQYRKVLYFYFQQYIFNLPPRERGNFIKSSLTGKIKSMIETILLSQKRRGSKKASRVDDLTGKPWVFVFGKNNYEATKFLAAADFLFVTDSIRTLNSSHPVYLLPIDRKLQYFWRFFSLLGYLLRTEGRRTWNVSDAVFASLGYVEAFEALIKKCRPSAVVFSNDHSIVPRALFWACKNVGVPTIYIQHASISPYMPPLDFDLSLLEGNDALSKYSAKGIAGKVRLVGIPRFDPYVQQKKTHVTSSVRRVGIAFNTVDSLEKIASLAALINGNLSSVAIAVRPHPKDKRDFGAAFKQIESFCKFSDPVKESPFDFILQCDLIIAGDSSIHLEAKMLNVNSVYFDFSEEKSNLSDLYGYFANGLIAKMNNADEIVNFIQADGNRYGMEKVKFYNEAIGSSFEGQSSQKAIDEIRRFLDSNKINR